MIWRIRPIHPLRHSRSARHDGLENLASRTTGVLLRCGDDARLVEYESLGSDAMLSVPTPDHYLPLLYVLGLRRAHEPVSFPVEGTDGGSVSMLAVQVG